MDHESSKIKGPTIEQILLAARYECASSLHSFIKLHWSIVEPKEPFVDGWHIEAICEHLEAVTAHQIKDLIISVPPRHMKSTSVSVMWPAWCWIRKPSMRWIFGSYAQTLSIRDSIKCRRVIESNLYRETFSPSWVLSDDQNQKTRFNNTATGYRIATSVGGTGTGEGGDVIVVDDPIKATDAESEVMRENVIAWWDNEMSTRGNNPETSAKVIIMQRLHENDLAGHCMKGGGYEVLRLPAEFEPKTMSYTKIGWADPRKQKGELLWPNRFSREYIDSLKKTLGSRGTASQLQQDPRPSEGGLFKRQWWKTYREAPARGQFEAIAQFWDCAQKAGITNDYSVCATWGKTAHGYYLLDLWRNKVEAPQLEMAAKSNAAKWLPTSVVIEDKSSGSSLIQSLRQGTVLPVIAYDPKQRDKQVRASAATPTVEAGNCFLPDSAPWVEDFIQEHEKFPLGDNDDQVDTTSMMVEHFSTMQGQGPRVRRL